MSVTAFKLITGEEIVAKVAGGSDLQTVIQKPFMLSIQNVGNGQIGLALVPWCLSNPDINEVGIKDDQIICRFIPSDAVKDQYLQQTSPIISPKSGLIGL